MSCKKLECFLQLFLKNTILNIGGYKEYFFIKILQNKNNHKKTLDNLMIV